LDFHHIFCNVIFLTIIKIQLNYSKGCNFEGSDETGFEDAISNAEKSDIVVVCLGEEREWTGENASRSTIALPAIQESLLQRLKKVGKPLILVLSWFISRLVSSLIMVVIYLQRIFGFLLEFFPCMN
jgi:hypothetical protein